MKIIISWRSRASKVEYLESLMKNTKKEAIPYNKEVGYEIGDYINHSKFGFGFIQLIVNKTKVEIFFENSEKVMLQNWNK